MIDGLKPYPAYKDSGVPWLGQVPAHWEVLPHRTVFAEVNDRNHPEEQMLSVTINKGVIRQASLLADTVKKDGSNLDRTAYKLVQPGDIAYNKMRAWQGAVGVSEHRGIVSPAYVVVRLRGNHLPRYFHYLFRTPAFAKEAERWSYGITSDQWSLRPEHFKIMYSSFPSVEEQLAIIHVLDYVDGCTRRFIRAKQRQVALLNEQKQAIVHQAVTLGVDHMARLKPSGFDWLGDIPEHWQVLRNGQLFAQRNETGYPELPILEVSLKTGVRVRDFANSDRKQVMSDRAKYKRAAAGDLAYNMMRMWQGAVGVAPVDGLVSPAYVVARPSLGTVPRFFAYLFRTFAYMAEVDKYSRGIVKDRNRLYWADFKQMPAPCPPESEQIHIVNVIEERTGTINRVIDKTLREIELLREHRTRLIADVVTGKLDVREAAALLPAEADEPDPLDDADTQDDETEELEEAGADEE